MNKIWACIKAERKFHIFWHLLLSGWFIYLFIYDPPYRTPFMYWTGIIFLIVYMPLVIIDAYIEHKK